MKSFRFRLERILQLRERAERERAEKLGAAMRTEAERLASRDAAEQRLERAGDQLADQGTGTTSAGAMRNLRLTVEAAAGQLESAEESHRAAANDVDDERTRFQGARKDRRVLERLREQRLETHDQDAVREEQREHDALAQKRPKDPEAA